MQRLACLFILVAVIGCKKDEPAAPTEPAAAPTADPAAAPTAPAEPAPAATPPPAAEGKACTLLTKEELAAIPALKDGAEGKPSKSGGADVCTWMTTQGVILQVFAYASDYDNSRKAFEELYQTKGEELSGVGDKAYTVMGKTGPISTATLVTSKGGKALSVQVMGIDDAAQSKEAAKTLANAVLSRL